MAQDESIPRSEKSLSPKLGKKKIFGNETVDLKLPDFDIQEVQDAAAATKQQALMYQEQVKFWRRSRWAKRDQEALKATIASLRQANNNLESIVQLLTLKDPSSVLPNSSNANSLWPLVTRVSRALVPG